MWCWIEFLSDNVVNNSYAMIQTLSGIGSNLSDVTVLEKYDSMSGDENDIYFVLSISIKSVEYILLFINHSDTDRNKLICIFLPNQTKTKIS